MSSAQNRGRPPKGSLSWCACGCDRRCVSFCHLFEPALNIDALLGPLPPADEHSNDIADLFEKDTPNVFRLHGRWMGRNEVRPLIIHKCHPTIGEGVSCLTKAASQKRCKTIAK